MKPRFNRIILPRLNWSWRWRSQSAALDRENASLYAEAGVKEYWIVLGERREVEVYREPSEGRYLQKRVFTVEERIDCMALPGVDMRVGDLFGDLDSSR